MAPGGPPGSGRGRGGKFKKFTRGGGKNFSKNLRPLDAEGNEMAKLDADNNSEKEEDSSDEESLEEEESNQSNLNREERRAAAKAKKEAAISKKKAKVVETGDLPTSSEDESQGEAMQSNPNHTKASRNQTMPSTEMAEMSKGVEALKVSTKGKPMAELSRREREAVQAQQAKERYQKLHEAGKTDEAKADLARLKLVREKREAEAARKQAEKEERERLEKLKKAEIDARESKRREAALGPAKGRGKSKA
ncbi:unnamed protein product [Blumeria hordei]|uniref:Casein kinase substrate phosphoprotein PP28 domain-containing protein n=2 Tax=Blumeria hordei TaxID=2867405 RepID=A0A383UQU6_BLUHO|nr:unnamed protein product [Blumeria hordei]